MELSPQHARLFTTPRPVHELYDLENDPFELRNLAEDPRYREELTRLQTVCEAWQTEVRAVHVMPESLLAGEDQTFASRWYIFHVDGGEQRWAKLFRAATQRSEFAVAARPPAQEPGVRWWQATGLFGRLTEHDASDLLIRQLDDSSEGVRHRDLSGHTRRRSPPFRSV